MKFILDHHLIYIPNSLKINSVKQYMLQLSYWLMFNKVFGIWSIYQGEIHKCIPIFIDFEKSYIYNQT